MGQRQRVGQDVSQPAKNTLGVFNGLLMKGIEIYMLKIDGNDRAIPYFQQCASTGDHYYNVSEPEHIPLVFTDILNGLEAELRLSR